MVIKTDVLSTGYRSMSVTPNERVIQPLSFNYEKFRAEFIRLKKMSSYERANDKAEREKERKWQEYIPLPRYRYWDDEKPQYTTILSPLFKGMGKPDRLSTNYGGGAVYAQRYVIARITEILAVARARGYPVLDCDLYYKSQRPPTLVVRYCSECKQKRAIGLFARSKNVYDGLGYACATCRKDRERQTWRRNDAA